MKKIVIFLIISTILMPVYLYSFLSLTHDSFTYRSGMIKCGEIDNQYFSMNSLIEMGCKVVSKYKNYYNTIKQTKSTGHLLDCRNKKDIRSYVIFSGSFGECEEIRRQIANLF